MDWSAFSAITTSITAATDIAKGLSAVRDGALVNEKTSALMEQLLQAQQGLLAHNTSLLQFQSEHFKTCEELRKLKEAASERGRYSLVSLGNRCFAYRVNVGPGECAPGQPGTSEPLHYVCQPCFDKGIKSVLQGRSRAIGLECPTCRLAMHVDTVALLGA